MTAPTAVQTLYIVLELGIYLSACVFLCFEERKTNADFGMLVVHHVVTIALICSGWSFKMYNYSIAIAAIHDCSDWILEYSKIFYYNQWVKTSNAMFTTFAFVFIATRLYFFPKFAILPWYTGAFQRLAPSWPFSRLQAQLFPGMLSALVTMHSVWSFFILRVLYNMARGKKAGDKYEMDE